MSQQTPPHGSAAGRSVADRVFGVAADRRTYANLLYLLARFPLGIAYFTVFVTALSMGVGLAFVLVGVPLLAGALALAGYVGVLEAELLRRVRGRRVTYRPVTFADRAVWPYLKAVVTEPRNYLLLVFALGSFAVGTALFTAISVLFTLAVVLSAAVAIYWVPGVEYRVDPLWVGEVEAGPLTVDLGTVGPTVVDTFPKAAGLSLVGLAVGLVGLHAVNLCASVLAGVTARVLDFGGETAAPTE